MCAADTLRDRIPVLSKLGMSSIRPASSPQRDTGVSPDSLPIISMSRRMTVDEVFANHRIFPPGGHGVLREVIRADAEKVDVLLQVGD